MDRIELLMSNTKLREYLSVNARQFIEENCRLDNIVKKEMTIYKRLIKL